MPTLCVADIVSFLANHRPQEQRRRTQQSSTALTEGPLTARLANVYGGMCLCCRMLASLVTLCLLLMCGCSDTLRSSPELTDTNTVSTLS